jgi:hypothetical protein
VEADLERWLKMEEGTLWLEEGFGTGWMPYGMGVGMGVYGRDEGDVGGKEARGERRDEAKMKNNVRNIREMREAVGLLKEGSDTPRVLVQLYFIKSRSLAEPISAEASMAGPIAKL